MRRSELSEEARSLLCKRTSQIAAAGALQTSICRDRINAWIAVQAMLVLYAAAREQGESTRASIVKAELLRHPHASSLHDLLAILKTQAATVLIQVECLEAIQSHPEIEEWI